MKYLTAVTAVLLVPMLITGLYGMNVALPLQKHSQAFWIITGMLVISSMITLFFFYNKKWI
jgi:magnesium transporter